jgi:hypothetical protein
MEQTFRYRYAPNPVHRYSVGGGRMQRTIAQREIAA